MRPGDDYLDTTGDEAVSATRDTLRHHAPVEVVVSSSTLRRAPVQTEEVERDGVWKIAPSKAGRSPVERSPR
jgi:hypothetical protein